MKFVNKSNVFSNGINLGVKTKGRTNFNFFPNEISNN